jgi:hypothetical protein
MEIYVVPDVANLKIEYVCDSQATIDARPQDKNGNYIIPSNQCSVGTQTNADVLLASNQQSYLTQQSNLFTVNLQTTVEGGVVWTIVDLSTEPPNTDKQYFVLDPTTGEYTEAIGLNSANLLLAQTQQTYLIFNKMNVYKTMTSWT